MILNFIIKILLVCVINCLETRLLIKIDGNMRSPEYKAIFSGRFRLRNETNNNKNGNWSICCSVFLTQCRYKPEIIYLCVFHSFLFGFCVFHLIKFDALKSSEKTSSVLFEIRSWLHSHCSWNWVMFTLEVGGVWILSPNFLERIFKFKQKS